MNRIKELRAGKGVNQEQLAKFLNVQRAAVSKYENGEIPLTAETINKLADYFDVTTDYLLGRTGAIKEKPSLPTGFPARLTQLRREHNLAQHDLASFVGVSQSTLSDWERGEISPDTHYLDKLSNVFNVTADYLLGRTEQKNSPLPEVGNGLDGDYDEEYNALVKVFSVLPDEDLERFSAFLQSAQDRPKLFGTWLEFYSRVADIEEGA